MRGREIARLVGISPALLTHWTRLEEDPCPVAARDGRGRAVDFRLEDVRAWMARTGRQGGKRVDSPTPQLPAPTPSAPAAAPAPAPAPTRAPAGDSLQELRHRELRARTVKSELEAGRLAGELVAKDEVVRAAKDQGLKLKSALDQLPDRLAAAVAAETDISKVHAVIAGEVRRVIQEFRDGLRLPEAPSPPKAAVAPDQPQEEDEA